MQKIHFFRKTTHFLGFAFVLCFLCSFTVFAGEQKEYESIVYNNSNGLLSAETNAICETKDGYIWIGTYAGLYRYDGKNFVQMFENEGISSVMDLYEDNEGKLWIGTNDNGLFVYNNGNIKSYKKENGLASNTVRCICGDSNNNIYVGTTEELCIIGKEESITKLSTTEEIYFVTALDISNDNMVVGVTNGGLLFTLQDGKFGKCSSLDSLNEDIYSCVSYVSNDQFLVGTSGSSIYTANISMNKIDIVKSYVSSSINGIENIRNYKDTIYICADNGFATYKSGKISVKNIDNFNNSISDVMVDYQGNIWVSSTKQGVLKLTESPFKNLCENELKNEVVNAIIKWNNLLYIGTDNGLYIFDKKNNKVINNVMTKRFAGNRVRCLFVDSKNQLWISTYGPEGLVCYETNNNSLTYNETANDTMGSRFRSTLELEDGTIVAASSTGLTFIKDKKVTKTLGEDDGLLVPQILTMIEKDGYLLVGSDGNGIYVIKDGNIIGNIGEENNLNSLVILRMVPYKDGIIVITSNVIYYLNINLEKYKSSMDEIEINVKKLDHFPYSNNYDALIFENNVWVFSSAGIFIVNGDNLIKNNKDYNYLLYNNNKGLDASLTANSWNYVDNDIIYFCASSGIRSISLKSKSGNYDSFKMNVNQVVEDDKRAVIDENGVYQINAGAKRIIVQPAIMNYTLDDPLIGIYLEGFDEDYKKIRQSSLSDVNYTNLSYGKYTFHLQILNDDGTEIIKEITVPIEKQAYFYQKPWFYILCSFVIILIVTFVTWMLANISHMKIIKKQYEEIRIAKEDAEKANKIKSSFLANMSHEIRTPINTILGMDELILREDINQNAKQFAADINQAGHALLSIVNDILDFSKIESGQMKIIKESYLLSDLISDIYLFIKLRAKDKKLDLIININPDIPNYLVGDSMRIRQILINLLTNAIKYTHTGSVELNVDGEVLENQKVCLKIAVKDTGIGIQKEDIGKLFNNFERLEENRNRNIEGTGLGLSITKHLLELMDSNLKVDSVYGKGSTFYFDLLQTYEKEEKIGVFSTEKQDNKEVTAYKESFTAPEAKVLMVDDNQMNIAVFKGLLKETQIKIAACTSGKKALELMKKRPFDLIFLDHMMPELDGIETFEIMKKDNICDDVPVIILTANAIKGAKEMYLSKGFTDYLSKPIDSKLLEEMLIKYLPKDLVQLSK